MKTDDFVDANAAKAKRIILTVHVTTLIGYTKQTSEVRCCACGFSCHGYVLLAHSPNTCDLGKQDLNGINKSLNLTFVKVVGSNPVLVISSFFLFNATTPY